MVNEGGSGRGLSSLATGFLSSQSGAGTQFYDSVPMLDKFIFTESDILISNRAATDPKWQQEVAPGINFVGKMRPLGFLGVLENLLPDVEPMLVSGQIIVPKDDFEIFIPDLEEDYSDPRMYPWERETKLPGIYLNVDLGLDFKLGKARFKDTFYRYYSPLSITWEYEDGNYREESAFTALLNIPSAEMSVAMTADLDPGASTIYIEGEFEGFSLGKLSHLADLAGSGLAAQIPGAFDKVLKPLEKIELMSLACEISWGNGISLDKVSMSIGAPDLRWNIWDDHIVVTEIGTQITLYSPFSNPVLDLSLWGTTLIEGSQLSIRGQKLDGDLYFTASLLGATIPLKGLMKKIAPKIPPPSDLSIDSIRFSACPGKFYRLSGAIAGEPNPWKIPLGITELVISNIKFDLTKEVGSSESTLTGNFSGELWIGKNIRIATNYAIPGQFQIRGVAGKIEFREMLSKLVGGKVDIPQSLDFTLLDSTLVIKKGNDGFEMQMSGQVEGFGMFAFELKKVNGKWGAAAGFSLGATKLSQIPGLSALKAIEKIVIMEDFTLVVATYDGPNFRFPDMAAFGSNTAKTSTAVQLPEQATGLVNGLNLYTKWRLDTQDKSQKALQKLFGLDPSLAITLQVSNPPTKSSKLFTTLETRIDGKWPLTAQLGLYLNNGQPSLFMAGAATFKVDKIPYQCDVAMSLLPTGIFFSGTMKGTIPFKGFSLSNIALQFGMAFSGLPSFGLAATLGFPNFSCSLAMFFDSTDPSKSVLAGAVTDVSMLDIASAFAKPKSIDEGIKGVLKSIELHGTQTFLIPDSAREALADYDYEKISKAFKDSGQVVIPTQSDQVTLVTNKKGQMWTLTNLYDKMKSYQLVATENGIEVSLNAQLYLAPQTTQIGTLQFTQGFFLNGAISILGMTSQTTVEVIGNQGIAVESSLSKPLVIYKSTFFKLSDTTGSKGAEVSLATFSRPSHPIEDRRNPHLYINGRLELMGMVQSCYLVLNSSGFRFDILVEYSAQLTGLSNFSGSLFLSYNLYGDIDRAEMSFVGGGSVNIDFDVKISLGELGKLKFKTTVDCSAEIGFVDNVAYAKFSGTFTHDGNKFSIKANMKADSKDLANIGKLAAKEIGNAFTDFFKDAEKWAGYAKKGFMEGVDGAEKVADVLGNQFNKSAQEVSNTMKSVGHSMEDIGDSIQDTFDINEKDLNKLLKQTGFKSRDVEKYTKSAFKDAKKVAKKAKKKLSKIF
ncbi:MAG: hypothetical protein H6581_16595 [Bacteroidia bacterium]|nr:hypothetical protein [Bacteroidia bacterium]